LGTPALPALPAGDDASILDDAVLWRRIHPDNWQLNPDTGTFHVTSGAFQNYPKTNNMSVGLAAEMEGPEVLIKGLDGYGVAEFRAGHARHVCNQAVARAPEPEQPWHAHVIGEKQKPGSNPPKRCLRDGCTIVVEPNH
jgi:hypothetical protein